MQKIVSFIEHIFLTVDRRSQRLLLFSSFLGVAWFTLELSFIYILQIFLFSLKLISSAQLQAPSWLPVGVLPCTVLLIAFGVVRASVNYLKSYFSIAAQHSFVRSSRYELIEKGLDSKYFTSSSDFVTLFSERVNQSGIFIQYISFGTVAFFSVLLFFGFGLFYAPREMVFSLSVTILLMAPIKRITYKIQKIGDCLIEEWNDVNTNVILAKRNMFFLEVYKLIDYKKNEIKASLSSYENNYNSFASIASFLSSLPLLVGIFVLSICSYFSVEYFQTPGVRVLSFFYIFLRTIQGLSELNTIYAVLKLNYPSFRDVRKVTLDLREMAERERDKKRALSQLSLKDNISFVIMDVSFGYSGERFLFHDVSMQAKTGDVVVIKGPSGVGKSTFLKLLLGLEKPVKGEIKINEINVLSLNPNWREYLGYVGPDPFLIKGSIRENLNFGHLNFNQLNDQDYLDALSIAGLDSEFKQSNITLDTLIAETSFLSTGQRQRLAIARAFLRKPLVVVFDEATANLDSQTEQQIVNNIQSLSSKILTIIVTHKNSFDKVGTKFINIGN